MAAKTLDLAPCCRRPMIAVLLLVIAAVGNSTVGLAAEVKTHKPSQKWALLIGVNDYAYLNKLKFCATDVQKLESQLLEAGFAKDQITLLNDSATDRKYIPSKTNIETQIDLICKMAEEGDVILLAFSGHGLERRGHGFLCPQDAKVDGTGDSLISIDWVYQKLGKSKASLRLMVVDACREEIEPDSTRGAGDLVKDATQFVEQLATVPKGTVLLNSCGPGEFAREDKRLSQGVFSHFLVQGLSGAADENGDGVVTVGELAKYTSRETKKYVARQYAYSQIPYVKQDAEVGALDYDIGRVKKTALASVQPPPVEIIPPKIVVPAPKSPEPKPLEKDPFKLTGSERAGETRSSASGIKFQFIPAGDFVMGSPESEKGYDGTHKDDEKPHRVRISRPFFLGTYTVTQEEYQAVMGSNPSYFSTGGSGADEIKGLNSKRLPVEMVSWFDALEFCNKLSEREGRQPMYRLTSIERDSGKIGKAEVAAVERGNGYRLPTEAQWEYACRAGTTGPFHFGDTLSGRGANCEGKIPYGTDTKGPSVGRTTEVGSYNRPNDWGLQDMHGNVFQWCWDWYEGAYYAKSPSSDPQGPLSGSNRVVRGGSWYSGAVGCRAASRDGHAPGERGSRFGFRLALVP